MKSSGLSRQDTLSFFGGDELAADVFLKKYAVTKPDGSLVEYLPSQMWERMAKAAASVEADKDHWAQVFYDALTDWKVVPQGSIMFALGNPYQRSSCSNCFVPGTEVLTHRGPVPIEDILEGDKVLTKSGNYHVVEQLHKSESNEIIRFKCFRTPEISCTPNHKFWSITKEQVEWGEGLQWNEIRHLRKGDYIALPTKSDFYKSGFIDAQGIVEKNLHKYSPSHDVEEKGGRIRLRSHYKSSRNNKEHDTSKPSSWMSQRIPVDEEFAYFLGVWYGDGCIFSTTSDDPMPRGITFTLGSHELDLAKYLCELGERYFAVPASMTDNSHIDGSLQVCFHNPTMGIVFEETFGRGCRGKRLWDFIYENWPKEYVTTFLRGIIDSDGTVTSDGDVRVVMVNKPFIKQVYNLARSHGYLVGYSENATTARLDFPKRTTLISGLRKTYNDGRLSKAQSKAEKSLMSCEIQGTTLVKIVNKSKVKHDGFVYNIGVDSEHSYCVSGIIAQNCFVIPIHDDSLDGIFDCAKEMSKTYAYRGGVGTDISALRPEGAVVSNAARTSTGAWSFMDFYSYVTRLIGQHGRRGALMITIADSHPDLLNFINSKKDKTKVTGANISVRLSDAFMQAVADGKEWEMSFDTKHEVMSRRMPAKDIWDLIVETATNTAEPGILFWDTILRESPSDCYAEDGFRTICTNPSLRWNTKISTPAGILNIKDLAACGECVIKNLLGEWQTAKAFISGRNQQLVKITFTNGQDIFCTKEHKWPILNTSDNLINPQTGKVIKKLTTDLISGNKIPLLQFDNPINNSQCPFSKDDGFVLGWYYGDGWKSFYKDGRCQFGFVFSDNEKKIGERVLKYTNNLARISSNLRQDHNAACITFSSSDKCVIKRFEEIGAVDKVDGLPQSIWCGNSEFIKGFIDGLFSSDGSVHIGKGLSDSYIVFTTSRANLAETLRTFLCFFGLRSTITSSINVKNDKFYNRFDLKISGIHVKKFAQQFSLSSIDKQDKIDQILAMSKSIGKNGKNPYANDRSYLVVKSVELTGIYEDVYDITVNDDTHTFQMECGITGNCSEIPLPAYDACTLLSMNLTKYTRNNFTRDAEFDFKAFRKDTQIAVRLLDNVKEIDLKLMPLKKQKDIAAKGRRIGMGTNGLGDALANLGIRYDSDRAVEFVDQLYEFYAKTVYGASVELAKEKGAFPVFDAKKEKGNPFLERIGFTGKPRRNIACLTCAPTGSLSCMCQTSSGVEPVFRNFYTRRRKITHNEALTVPQGNLFEDKMGEFWQEYTVAHHNVQQYLEHKGIRVDAADVSKIKLPRYFVESHEIDWNQRVKLQATMQKWIDHAISSTCNLPAGTDKEIIKQVYTKAYKQGCKGFTVYVDGCREGQPLVAEDVIHKTDAPKRPKTLTADVYHATVKGELYFVMVGMLKGEPYEVFAGRNGFIGRKIDKAKVTKRSRGAYEALLEDDTVIKSIGEYITDEQAAVTRLISLSLRHGADIKHCVNVLEKVPGDLHNFARSIARVLKKYIPDNTVVTGDNCPDCGSPQLVRSEGCKKCVDCAWTACL